MPSSSAREHTLPLGLLGELRISAFVRSVTWGRSASASTRKPFASSPFTITGTPPAMRTISG